MPGTADLAGLLAELEEQGLGRRRCVLEGPQGVRVRLDGRDCLSFSSNDYLGLANHPGLVFAAQLAAGRFGVGAGAAHLLTGHHQLHHELETAFSAFVGLPAALLFSTGYMANLGVVSALLERNGAVFADRLNHASLVDAARLSGADHQRYRHLDLDDLDRRLKSSKARARLIATDAVFSMDGDIAPVPELLELAERHDAWLYLDDAHGFGVLGEQGRGVLERHASHPKPHSPRLIYLATLGKAAGVAGACVAGSRELVEWLVNKARTYVFTTAMPPMLAAAALKSLELIATEAWRRQRLAVLVQRLQTGVVRLPWRLLPSETPIQPLLVGGNADALRLADGLRQRGILIPAIRPPTVPQGTARLRISLSAGHTEADVDTLLTALADLARP
ncbi:MAG TPA: 8-amino-7-oxononanoate synthase [Thiobacillaceae bacterium]|nr:8-amino-7-oxononanoate synthase [Thiobacillaceae bacterium]